MCISASYYLPVVVAVDTVRRFPVMASVRLAVRRSARFVLVGLGVRRSTPSRAAVWRGHDRVSGLAGVTDR
jgi:hypothetical protein